MKATNKIEMWPYCTAHYTLDECTRIKARLEASGKFRKVQIRRRYPNEFMDGQTVKFGQVFVPREAHD